MSCSFRIARAGEFTKRAFLQRQNGSHRLRPSPGLIASSRQPPGAAAAAGGLHELNVLKRIRQNFIDFAALIELELDFSEEDVEFADRSQLRMLLLRIETEVERLDSFTGQAIKDGMRLHRRRPEH